MAVRQMKEEAPWVHCLRIRFPFESVLDDADFCGHLPDDLLHRLVLHRQFPSTRSHGMAKAGWAILILFLPILGALIYIIARPAEADANVVTHAAS